MFGGIRRIYGVSTAYVADLESNVYAPRVVARDKKRRLHKQSEFGLGSRVYSLVIILRTIPILYSLLILKPSLEMLFIDTWDCNLAITTSESHSGVSRTGGSVMIHGLHESDAEKAG